MENVTVLKFENITNVMAQTLQEVSPRNPTTTAVFNVSNAMENTFSVLSWPNIVKAIVLYTIVLVTISGNLLVLIAVYVNKKLQTTFNYYVVNLAITDFAVAVTAMTFHTTDNVLGYWPFGEFLCGVWIFFDYGMTFVSVFTLVLISVDRFWSVTWSVHYHQHQSKKRTLVAIVCLWLFMLALWLPPCIYDRVHNSMPRECVWEPALNTEFVIVIATLGHHGACVVLLFCYVRVFIFMHKRKLVKASRNGNKRMLASALDMSIIEETSNAEMTSDKYRQASDLKSINASIEISTVQKCENREQSTSKTSQESKKQRRERAVFITLSYVLIGYAVCWVPFHVVFDISSVCPSCVPGGVYSVTFWMTYINSTVNPFLYNFCTPEFRRTFRRLLCRK